MPNSNNRQNKSLTFSTIHIFMDTEQHPTPMAGMHKVS